MDKPGGAAAPKDPTIKHSQPIETPLPPKPAAAPAPEPVDEESNVVDLSMFRGTAGEGIQDPFIALVMSLLGPAQDAIVDLQTEVAQLRLANAELKAQLAEVRSKADTTDFVVQRLQIDRTGPPGPQGMMGRDGAVGIQGPQGARGPRGQPGDRIVSWRLSPEEFLAYPITEQGKELPPLNLMPFFMQYNEESGDQETALATAQTELQQTRLEHDIEAARAPYR
jgi:hypothetical protein